jgi:hypothetical protein
MGTRGQADGTLLERWAAHPGYLTLEALMLCRRLSIPLAHQLNVTDRSTTPMTRYRMRRSQRRLYTLIDRCVKGLHTDSKPHPCPVQIARRRVRHPFGIAAYSATMGAVPLLRGDTGHARALLAAAIPRSAINNLRVLLAGVRLAQHYVLSYHDLVTTRRTGAFGHAPDSHPIPVGASSTPDTKLQTVNGFNRLLRLKPY